MSDRFARLQEVFTRARELAPDDRLKYLDEACDGDDGFRRDVESLLTHGGAQGFLDETLNAPPPPSEIDQTPTNLQQAPTHQQQVPTPAIVSRLCPTCGRKFDHTRIVCPHDGDVLGEDPDWLVGTTFDRTYFVERLLDRGGMGAVYLARHEFLNRKFAIKTLVERFQGNADVRERFIREARALLALSDHPNVVKVSDLRVVEGGLIYMVLEYLDGQTLRSLVKVSGRQTPEQLVELLGPVASVLDAAHARGIVHRDLKPENIMVARSGATTVVKVFDLGVAKLLDIAKSLMGGEDGRGTLTTIGQLMGTPLYMSPEQWGFVPRDGDPDVDGRADVYSLGVIAYELVSGSRPFGGSTVSEMRREHRTKVPPPLDEIVEGVSPAFARAVTRAMAKDRSDRFATAGEFLDELRAALLAPATEPYREIETVVRSTEPSALPYRPSKMIIGGALAGFLAIGALAVWFAMSRAPLPEPPPVVVPTPVRVEVLRFSVGIESGKSFFLTTSRTPVEPKRKFFFRFVPDRDGFLYLLSPLGRTNMPGTLLTSSRGDNFAQAGETFDFPVGEGLSLSDEAASTQFTVIFSPTPLTSPTFLTGPPEHTLSAAEQQEFATLRDRFGQEVALVEGKPAESVTLPDGSDPTHPVAFTIDMKIVTKSSPGGR